MVAKDDDEAKIRTHYRDIRDKLKSTSTKLDMISKVRLRPDISLLLGNEASIYEWLATVFDELEQLRLELNNLDNRHEEIIDVFKMIRAWQKDYQPILDEFKQERDRFGKALKKNGDHKNEEKRNG